MLKIIGTIVLTSLFTLPLHALELNKYLTYLTDGNRIQVTIAEIKNNKKQVLAEIRGVNSDIDEVIFLADIIPGSRKSVSYRIGYDGGNWNLLMKDRDNYTLYIPGAGNDGIRLTTDKEGFRSQEDMLATYEEQQNSNVQADLAKFRRQEHQDFNSEKLAERDEFANKECGTALSTEVDWSAISDDQLKSMSIQGYCGAVASNMAHLCQSDADKKASLNGITKIRCDIGDELKIHKDGNTILFQTSKDAPNQDDFIRAYLLTL